MAEDMIQNAQDEAWDKIRRIQGEREERWQSEHEDDSGGVSYVDRECHDADGREMRYFCGPIGEFVYNPHEFQIAKIPVPGDPDGRTVLALKYCGTETNGKNIRIPEGVTDLSYSFADDRTLVSIPDIPGTVKYADGAFCNCTGLRSADGHIPAGMKSGAFMFAGCSGLESGPASLPGGMEDCAYMFAGCGNITRVPRIPAEAVNVRGMFQDCGKLEDIPDVPSSVEPRNAKYMTEGCSAYHSAVSAEESVHNEYEKSEWMSEKLYGKGHPIKNTAKGFTKSINGIFGGYLEYHAFRQAGFGIFGSAITMALMRDTIPKDVPSGIAMNMMNKGKGYGTILLSKAMMNRSANEERNQQSEIARLSTLWDRTHMHMEGCMLDCPSDWIVQDPEADAGTWKEHGNFPKQELTGVTSPVRAPIGGKSLLERFPSMGYEERQAMREEYCHTEMIAEAERNLKRTMNDEQASTDDRMEACNEAARFFKTEMAACVDYGVRAQDAILSNKHPDKQRMRREQAGLNDLMKYMTSDRIQAIREMDGEYHIFSRQDKEDLNRMAEAVNRGPIFDTDSGETSKHRNYDYHAKFEKAEPKGETYEY